jgi:cholest-4-en-3-one 26-monooxygenase
MMDPPQHTRYRKIVSSAFTPRVIRLFEEQVRRRSAEIIDAVIGRGECDFVTDVAAELPLQAIAEILGVPQEDRGKLFDWSNKMVGSSDPEYLVSPDEAMNVSVEMFTYANALGEEKRAAPTDDIVTAIVSAEVEGEQLSEMEFDMFFMLLSVAGNETTRNAISGGLRGFSLFPDEKAKLLADPELIDSAVEEIIRWTSPVLTFVRTVTRPHTLHGVELAAGDRVLLLYQSANRDETVFDDPHAFRLDRPDPRAHVAFGGGPHVCPGASLARLEGRVALSVFLDRVAEITPVDPGAYEEVPVAWAHGPRTLLASIR